MTENHKEGFEEVHTFGGSGEAFRPASPAAGCGDFFHPLLEHMEYNVTDWMHVLKQLEKGLPFFPEHQFVSGDATGRVAFPTILESKFDVPEPSALSISINHLVGCRQSTSAMAARGPSPTAEQITVGNKRDHASPGNGSEQDRSKKRQRLAIRSPSPGDDDRMAEAHGAIMMYESTGSTKTELTFRAMEILFEMYHAGDPHALATIRVVPSDDKQCIHFNILDMMFVLKLVLLTIGLALNGVASWSVRKQEFQLILQCAHEIITGMRTPNKTPFRLQLDRAWNTFKTRTFGAVGIRIREKPPRPFKLGTEWVHDKTVWEMPVFPGSRCKKPAIGGGVHGGAGGLRPEEKVAKEWAAKAWSQLIGESGMSADLACIGSWSAAKPEQ
jgi:hypothetical protein